MYRRSVPAIIHFGAACLATVPAVACSGPAALMNIELREAFATWSLAVCGILVLIAAILHVRTPARLLRHWSLLAAILVLHPVGTVSARSGDCGMFLEASSFFWIGLAFAATCVKLAVASPRDDAPKILPLHRRIWVALAIVGAVILTGSASWMMENRLASDLTITAAGWTLGLVIFGLTERRQIMASRRWNPQFCRQCGYNLIGSPGPDCPECGRTRDASPARPHPADPEPARPPQD